MPDYDPYYVGDYRLLCHDLDALELRALLRMGGVR